MRKFKKKKQTRLTRTAQTALLMVLFTSLFFRFVAAKCDNMIEHLPAAIFFH